MSMTADAYILAIERAFPGLDDEGREAVFEAACAGKLTDEQSLAIVTELNRIDHLDVRSYDPTCATCRAAVVSRLRSGRPLPAGVPAPKTVPLVIIGQGDSRRVLCEEDC